MMMTKGKGKYHYSDLSCDVYDDLGRSGWQWFVTANTPVLPECLEVEEWKGRLLNLILQGARSVVAAKGVWLRWPCSHFHILLATNRTDGRLFGPTREEVFGLRGLRGGRPGYDGLHGERHQRVQAKWRKMTGGCSLRILPVNDAARVAGYIAGLRNVDRPGQRCEYLKPVNLKLLRRLGL